jgi:hypothetical protein
MLQFSLIGIRLHSFWRIQDLLAPGDVDLTFL